MGRDLRCAGWLIILALLVLSLIFSALDSLLRTIGPFFIYIPVFLAGFIIGALIGIIPAIIIERSKLDKIAKEQRIQLVLSICCGIGALSAIGIYYYIDKARELEQAQNAQYCTPPGGPIDPQNPQFPKPSICVSRPFVSYWRQHKGADGYLGQPISSIMVMTTKDGWTGKVQWFEGGRLEDHGELGVMAGRLGVEYLLITKGGWEQGTEQPKAGCMYFQETGYNLCGAELGFWQQDGSLEHFGMPISAPFKENSHSVQYFERSRMQYDDNNGYYVHFFGSEVISYYISGQ